ncbi:hypothetical protein Uis1B_2162 [Bifidobacterium margollesii]|uniref:Uncharacterized protein n=1 Tax=Bifidobacterium margollesii TaxID=2020964 RepID=A0A2N5J756_9BIFI|nr:hypothetical protein [Bifidobacterium margollesii]PLS30036.1 hypothetical protein Uis1B_2162 [Bifidobacterium margollesii]
MTNDNDNDDGDKRVNFTFTMPSLYGADGQSRVVRMRVCRVSHHDLSAGECADLATRSCHLACIAADVVRGRLRPQILDNRLTEKSIDRLMFLAALLETDKDAQDTWHRHLPVVPQYLFGTLLNPECFDACIGLSIGYEDYHVSLVLRRKGSRWLCTMLDFG